MSKNKVSIVVTFLLFSVILLGARSFDLGGTAQAATTAPYTGVGTPLDIHEYARNLTGSVDGGNSSSFKYNSSLYPSGYRGYRIHANVTQIHRVTNPLPHGDMENTTAFSSTWNLTNLDENLEPTSDPLVLDPISSVTGQNPTRVMDVELAGKKLLFQRTTYIDNDFNYTSEFVSNYREVRFQVKLSGDITDKDWLFLRVAIWNQGSEKGYWVTDLKALKDDISDQWSNKSFTTAHVNGQIRLRITLFKQEDKNEDVKGHIYFDNFEYVLGSDVTPSEAGLTLEGEPIIDSPSGPSGDVDVYADSNYGEEIPFADCWNTDLTFQFISTEYDNLTFYYEYAMYVKLVNPSVGLTTFSAPTDGTPTWTIQYPVPIGRPPGSHIDYAFGFHIFDGWEVSSANDSLGNDLLWTTPTSGFVKTVEGAAQESETYTFYTTSQNYVKSIQLQKGNSITGPFEPLVTSSYYLIGDYMRIMAEIEPFETSSQNFANVTIHYPNGTHWNHDDSVTFFENNNTLHSTVWQITGSDVDDDILGQNWIVTVAFDNNTQCGYRQAFFTVVVDTEYTKVSPTDGDNFLWDGPSIHIEVTWRNNHTGSPIVDASSAQVRYVDRNLVTQYVAMSDDGAGSYYTDVSTTLISPDRNAEIYVELFRYGCENASYAQGTSINFTINLINKIEIVMIKPTLITGQFEFTGETSAIEGYTSIVKFYDPYQSAYVLDESAIWPDAIVNYTRYNDPTGPGSWVEAGTGEFNHNFVDRTFFKADLSYVSVERVKYEVSMRIEGASWDFQPRNFTIIINIVSSATDLDAERTSIDYPPVGDGWTLFDQTTDNYAVTLYWSEQLNITVFYHHAENTTGIPNADSATIQVGLALPIDMDDLDYGYYHKMVDTSSLGIGLTKIYVTVNETGYASQTILIDLTVEARQTQLTKDKPGSTIILPWSGTYDVTFNYTDIVEGTAIPIPNAVVNITTNGLPLPGINNQGGGIYTITFDGTAIEGTYSLLINFSLSNYQYKIQTYEITIRLISSQVFGIVNTPTVSWGENATISLTFTDVDNIEGIPNAIFNFTSHGIWLVEDKDYWITSDGFGGYTLTLNTTQVPEGTHGYTLIFTFSKEHYQTAQTAVYFQVRDIQTILFITETPQGTIIPHGDVLIIVLHFNNTDQYPHQFIPNASIGCNWDAFFWNFTGSAIPGTYILMIRTQIHSEGLYSITLWAQKAHHQDGTNIQTFQIRIIQTTAISSPDYISDHPIGDNITFSVYYNDFDHPGEPIRFANVSINWAVGFYTITDLGNSTYRIELNTSISSVGTHILQISLGVTHYESRIVYVTLDIIHIPLTIELLEPIGGQWDVEYNTLVFLTVNITDHNGNPVNDAIVEYTWAGRAFVTMIPIGNGIYNVTFLANSSVGFNHQITIQASNPGKYSSITTNAFLLIRPTATLLDSVTDLIITTIIGETFVITVNFTTLDGFPIDGATVSYTILNSSSDVILTGFFNSSGSGVYTGIIGTTGWSYGDYTVNIQATRTTVSNKELSVNLVLHRILTEIVRLDNQIEVLTASSFVVRVHLNDTHHGLLISTADLTITIIELNIIGKPMFDHGNGTYSYIGNSGLFEGVFMITIEASVPPQYETPDTVEIPLIVRQNPIMQNIVFYVAITAVIVIILLAIWFAYARVFSVPWMVRKMRKMSKTITKGDVPTLSKMDVSKIANRTDIMSDIIEPYYGSVGLAATAIVIPSEIDWKEREAEDAAIWAELKALPLLEYEQKLELFQQMKQIVPSERLWFLDDLKKQMADGTRFARKVKEPEISEALEQELQVRLATFPALGTTEKQRIAAQLRKLPREEWDEIFHTLAVAETPRVVTIEDQLGPDEFPTLTQEERERILEEIKDLTDEEKQKVLSTLRKKHTEPAPKRKVVKGKKKFIIDDSDESK